LKDCEVKLQNIGKWGKQDLVCNLQLMNEYINIGRIVASFGLKGEVIIKHALGKKTAFTNIEAIFVEEHKGSYLPYFVAESKAKSEEETYVKFEAIDTKETANRLSAKNVWLLDDDFRKLAGKTAPISLLGFQLLTNTENLGPIEEVIEQPHQVLLRISLDGKEALIPLHAETLDKIDHKKKQVFVTLPDGLLDVYR
jgi:16S rRNA processing protein RimM